MPTFAADRVGVYNMLVPAMALCAALIFAMFGATDGAGVVLVGLVFGFASGACEWNAPRVHAPLTRTQTSR